MAEHEEDCPDIGPICSVRAEPPQRHVTELWLTELRLLGEYGLAPGWAVQGSLPLRVIRTTTRFTNLAGEPVTLDYQNIHHRDETLAGLGDAQLFVHRGLGLGPLKLGLRVGVSLPIGVVHDNPYLLGDQGLPHEHVQMGTGTFDPVLGLDLSHAFTGFSLSGFVQTQVPLYSGPTGYRAGARGTAGLLASSKLGLTAPDFRLALIGVHEWAERWNGEVPLSDGNQGKTDLFLGPGVTLPFGKDWSVSLDVRARIYGHAVNAQLEMPLLLEVSLGRLFHLEGDDDEKHEDPHAERGDVIDLVTEGEAAVLEPVGGKLTVFDFWAPWCEACKPLDTQLRQRAATHPGMALRRINIVDFDSPIALAALPGVSVLPHVRVLGPNGEVRLDESGPPDVLLRKLDALLAAP